MFNNHLQLQVKYVHQYLCVKFSLFRFLSLYHKEYYIQCDTQAALFSEKRIRIVRALTNPPESHFFLISALLLQTSMYILVIRCNFAGMRYFIIEGKKIGISKLWTRGAIWLFLIIVILGYITTVYLLGRVITFTSH